jgi:hypothetical protein
MVFQSNFDFQSFDYKSKTDEIRIANPNQLLLLITNQKQSAFGMQFQMRAGRKAVCDQRSA